MRDLKQIFFQSRGVWLFKMPMTRIFFFAFSD